MTRWEQTPELAPGWRRGAVITAATSNLGPGYPEKRVRGGGDVAFFPATHDVWALRFDVLLGTPDRDALTINDCVGDVGRMTLSSGAGVWVVVSEMDIRGEFEAGLAEVRRQASATIPDGIEVRGWAWGSLHEDGAPMLMDQQTGS